MARRDTPAHAMRVPQRRDLLSLPARSSGGGSGRDAASYSAASTRSEKLIGLSFVVGTVIFLVGREVRAYAALKLEVAALKTTVGTMEDNFKRATAEQMTFVRQAAKQLVDLSAAHKRLEEEVGGAGGGGEGVMAERGGAGVGVSGGGADVIPPVRQQQQWVTVAGGGGEGGGAGNLRGGGAVVATSADDGGGLWETSGSEAKAAGGLGSGGSVARNIKDGELPWDSTGR